VRGKKGKTTFYFCASKGYDNYVTTANEPELARNIVTLLQTLDTDMATAASIKAKELELKSISEKNAEINKQLEETKKQESQKAKEIDALKKKQAAPDPVK
jgi:DNA-binding transcriptional regulator GbsR (MarR family)